MLTKCANPTCNVGFRYSSQGKIFRVELSRNTPPRLFSDADEFQPMARRWTEFFWLCSECARDMVVVADRKSRFRVARIAPTLEIPHHAAA